MKILEKLFVLITFKMVVTDLSKEQALNSDPNAMQHIYLYLQEDGNRTMSLILKKLRETILEFSQEFLSVFQVYSASA